MTFVQQYRVYCKYHYLEGHEFDTPEEEWLNFVTKIYDDDFVWEKQYEASLVGEELESGNVITNNSRGQ
jgi:hypothetical protein